MKMLYRSSSNEKLEWNILVLQNEVCDIPSGIVFDISNLVDWRLYSSNETKKKSFDVSIEST